MVGYNDVREFKQLEEEIDRLGFMICQPNYSSKYSSSNAIGIKPKDQGSLPIYGRDAELFTGSVNDLKVWVRGVKWAREYDVMLNVSSTKTRERREDNERHKKLISMLTEDFNDKKEK